MKILGKTHKKPNFYYLQLDNGSVVDVKRIDNNYYRLDPMTMTWYKVV